MPYADKEKASEYAKNYRRLNREKLKLYQKDYDASHPERRVSRRGKRSSKEYEQQYREANKDAIHVNSKRYRDGIRKYIIDLYGAKCTCCGESEPAFLTIDHVRNNGSDHRKAGLRGTNFYRFLKNLGRSEDYQVLCWNCNCARSLYGECPHKKEPRR